MKLLNIKNFILVIFEVIIINALGFILINFNFNILTNCIIYTAILVEILLAIRVSYKTYNINSNNITIIVFVLIFIIFFTGELIATKFQIPDTCLSSYFFTLGFLIIDSCHQIYKRNLNINKIWPLIVRFVGIVMFILCIMFGYANFFGLLHHV